MSRYGSFGIAILTLFAVCFAGGSPATADLRRIKPGTALTKPHGSCAPGFSIRAPGGPTSKYQCVYEFYAVCAKKHQVSSQLPSVIPSKNAIVYACVATNAGGPTAPICAAGFKPGPVHASGGYGCSRNVRPICRLGYSVASRLKFLNSAGKTTVYYNCSRG